ncbi:hypothetical protein PLICRDRAFT_36405 [Plicaturopsis crispa FD-325 SS-3]|nr:hypothetical protein PLICRDRAFT_36405 [Plicaturopsis crispa FD-325 SS-3]
MSHSYLNSPAASCVPIVFPTMSAPRRSLRLVSRGAQGPPNGALLSTNGNTSLNKNNTSRPGRKRQRKGGDGVSTIRLGLVAKEMPAKFAKMSDMPLEVLFEIFGYLHPMDLLNLCRTTKDLRAVLLRRSVRSTWKAALSSVDKLPECPPDLQEPQYTRLLFDTHCHFCLAPNAPTILWACRVRCCTECSKTELVPQGRVWTACLAACLAARHLFLSHEFMLLLPYGVQNCREVEKHVVLKSDRDIAAEKILELANDMGQLRSYVNERIARTRDIQTHGERCGVWHNNLLEDRSRRLDELRERRKEAIFAKLRDLGWGDEIDRTPAYILSGHELFKQPKELTEHSWLSIKGSVICFMEGLKQIRLGSELLHKRLDRQSIVARLVKAYVLTRPPNDIIPQVADVCSMPDFRSLIEAPVEMNVDADSFSGAMANFPRLVDDWRESVSCTLVKLLPECQPSTNPPSLNLSSLELATTWFHCHICTLPITFPRILVHHCMTGLSYSYDQQDTITGQCFMKLSCEPWNYGGSRVAFHDVAAACARRLVELCGRDPLVTTASEMYELDARFSCSTCRYGRTHCVMTWDKAVSHSVTTHSKNAAFDVGSNWVLLPLHAEQRVKRAPTEGADSCAYPFGADAKVRHCKYCRTSLFFIDISEHLRQKHNITAMQEGDAYYDIDTCLHRRPPLAVRLELDV